MSIISRIFCCSKMHYKCVNKVYPRSGDKVMRSFVPEDKISWEVDYPEYAPVEYTSPNILAKPPYADPDISDPNFSPKWNDIDGEVNRKSHQGKYEIVSGRPRYLTDCVFNVYCTTHYQIFIVQDSCRVRVLEPEFRAPCEISELDNLIGSCQESENKILNQTCEV